MKNVIKQYGHNCGFSATFRQWRATSHCRFIHGYALAVKLTFACADDEVDENGWVINFGGLKPVKAFLEETFDHKTLVAEDDPELETFRTLASELGTNAPALIQLVEVKRTGCEAFAEMIFEKVNEMLLCGELGETNAQLMYVEVREHEGNAAGYCPDRRPARG
jgi:6-pyruvoyltetrahydropterin/6-carboxytetrahydropterin synthase